MQKRNVNTVNTYIVKHMQYGRVGGDRITLTITGTQAQVVNYLRDNVEPAWDNAKNVTLGKYIAEVINYRDSEGGTPIWGIYNAQGEEIREMVDGYSWHDEWDNLQEGEQFVNKTVIL